jgi:E3 ubiquitin-protein ligase UBR7
VVPTEEEDEEEEVEDEEKTILIPSNTYDGLICAACVRKSSYAQSRAGSIGWMIIEPSQTSEGGFEVIGREISENGSEGKRKERDDELELCGKKRKQEDGEESLLHPTTAASAQIDGGKSEKGSCNAALGERSWKGKGDVFLAKGVRQRLLADLDVSQGFPFTKRTEQSTAHINRESSIPARG